MRNIVLTYFFILFFFCGFIMVSYAQCAGGSCRAPNFKSNQSFNKMSAGTATKKEPKRYYYEETWEGEIEGGYSSQSFDDEEDVRKKDITWKRKGFEFFIGGGIYFGDKKTALYYNGAPENNINLNLILNNRYYWDEVLLIMRRAYPYIDTIVLNQSFNQNSGYSIAMDIALGFRYRIQKNWYVELSYSFRRLSAENRFEFKFPGVPPSNIEKPYSKDYSRWQYLMAREDRHYIDFSIGYIMQKHAVVKPFLSAGLLFTYIRINRFLAIIEDAPPYDLLQMARYPDWIPGVQEMPNYRDWAGPGYGFSVTLGLKIAANRMVSLDPIFQLSIANFGNNSNNLPGFDTSICFNYMVGFRLVMNDGLFSRNK